MAREPWFSQGVEFSCQPGCTRCCGGAPGDVFVSAEEIRAIAAFMNLPLDQFHDSFVRHYSSGRMSLTERPNGDCVLLGENGCSVYDVRPKQCRDYPFWPELMKSMFAWVREADRCPGIGSGELHPAPKIIDLLKSQQK